MSKRASLIPDEEWEKHRQEIVCRYLKPRSTLDQVIDHMVTSHGFRASKNQYTKKLKDWRIAKNSKASIWKSVDRKMRKRELAGKESNVLLYGRLQSRAKVQKEIARNVTFTSTFEDTDAPTPEEVSVLTPPADNFVPSSHRVYIDNLPSMKFKRELQSFIHGPSRKSMPLENNEYATIRPSRLGSAQHRQYFLDFLHTMDEIAEDLPDSVILLPGTLNDKCGGIFPHLLPEAMDYEKNPLAVCDTDVSISTIWNIMNHYITMAVNNLLPPSLTDSFLKVIVDHEILVALSDICSPISPFLKIFLRRFFPSAVRSGDTLLAGKIMEYGIHPDSFPTRPSPLAIAVRNNDLAMIELLCTAGATPKIRSADILDKSFRVPLWGPKRIQILHMLLSHGADPECFIMNEKRGFPLVDAALRGGLDAVNLLVQHGANVNNYVRGYYGTALQAAMINGYWEVGKRLIQLGADPNPIRELFHWKSSWDDSDPHLQLLAEYRDLNESQAIDSAVARLQRAAMEGWIPVTIVLLRLGVDVAATFQGKTAIDRAAERGRFDMLQLLLNEYQGSEDLKTVCDRAASYAQKEGHVEISEWLKEYPVSDRI